MNVRTAFGMTATVIALSGMAACGTHHADGAGSPSHPQSPSSSSPSSSPSNSSSGSTQSPLVIKLNAANGTYKMVVGQKLVVQVAAGTKIQPSQKNCSGGGNGGALKQLCTAGSNYEYQAVRSGSAQFTYTIRPDCKPGMACPAWIRNASFEVSVS